MSKKVLYFTKGVAPTKEEADAAQSLGAVMRNGSAVGANDYLEKCDSVAGTIPKAYAKYPVAETTKAAAKAKNA